jgi:predicted regulator of Ras-like GTPase activity (Roadblock/LC7/MglB family)
MTFDKILREIVDKVDGALGAAIMGFDGISIAKYIKGGSSFDIEALSIEFSRMISEAVRTANTVKLGTTIDIALSTKEHYLVFYVLPGNYFITLLLKEAASLGKGRYVLRQNAPLLVAEL